MTNSPDQTKVARQLLKQQSVGVLSTHSIDVEGYPFGSITSYALNYDGEPTIFISNLAQHTRNIKSNNRVSLTVFDLLSDDPQASGRLTWIGDAESVSGPDEEMRRRYSRYAPSAASYINLPDFHLYSIKLRRARFIGGFGQIFWVDPGALLVENPFRDSEEGIIEHMNQDHKKALLHYCTMKGITPDEVTMIGIDGEGFDLMADKRKIRIDFEAPVTTMEEARAALVKLAGA